MKTYKCPNCGAPAKHSYNHQCEYCGTLFDFNEPKEKTIVKLSKNDKYDKRLGFLIAYFQYNSGLSKTQANKYLDSLVEEDKKGSK